MCVCVCGAQVQSDQYIPTEDIHGEMSQLEGQLDQLEQRGVELESKLRDNPSGMNTRFLEGGLRLASYAAALQMHVQGEGRSPFPHHHHHQHQRTVEQGWGNLQTLSFYLLPC